jgi:hypothetical protein
VSRDPNLIRVFSVDDHPLLREGIAALVNAGPDLKLIAEACMERKLSKSTVFTAPILGENRLYPEKKTQRKAFDRGIEALPYSATFHRGSLANAMAGAEDLASADE